MANYKIATHDNLGLCEVSYSGLGFVTMKSSYHYTNFVLLPSLILTYEAAGLFDRVSESIHPLELSFINIDKYLSWGKIELSLIVDGKDTLFVVDSLDGDSAFFRISR
jgi:hypothetical protein